MWWEGCEDSGIMGMKMPRSLFPILSEYFTLGKNIFKR